MHLNITSITIDIMGRICKACMHPQIEEINRALMDGSMTLAEIEGKYDIGVNALYRHRKNHLDPVIQEIKAKAKDSAQKDYIEGQAAAQMILKHLPEVLDKQKPSLKEIIDVIKIVTGASGNGTPQKDIIITWGIGAGDKGKIQVSDSVYQPEGITDDDVKELESTTEKRKTVKAE
jgi:hypothetical protein